MEIDLDSSCAIDAIMVSTNSLFESKLHKFSFSKYTSTPADLSFLIYEIVSRVLRANLEMDFVTIKSIFPSRASVIIDLNPSRFFVLVPLIPSSAYTLTNSHSGLLFM